MTTNGTLPTARRHHFASGAQVRLELPDGEWVTIRAELTYAQASRLTAIATGDLDTEAEPGERFRMTPLSFAAWQVERLAIWLLDWSLCDDGGEHVVVSREAIEALHPDTAAEVHAALDAYDQAQQAKKAPAGNGTAPPGATSSSVRTTAGAGPH